MKTDIILSGVGGQGILSIAATIGTAALQDGLNIKQSEVHGMSQRGGDVSSNMRVSDKPIASDLISKGKADVILSVEPMEALRFVSYLKKDGWLITNSKPFKNIPNYPDIEGIYEEIRKIKNHIIVDADGIAKELKSLRSSNIVMLGAASPFIDMNFESFKNALRTIFGKKGEDVVAKNILALEKGREFTMSKINK
ncbi:MAG: indolepyruvate oxidoreductase subunit beta [Bacteroidetes bacterium]|nr:MAG: indolepyruvate oxidoreductase subunit beta [Bacteroidota bacterium]